MSAAGDDSRRVPTVIVSRRVVPGREAEVERWMQRMHAAATMQPGYVSDDHQPPDARHPDEWVVTYQFTDTDALDAWLSSPIRRKLIAEGREFIQGEARHQVLAVPTGVATRPVTAVISSKVKSGCEAAYRAVHADIEVAMAAAPGFLRSELFDAVPGIQEHTIVVFAFDARAHLDAWLDSDSRRQLVARLEPLVEGERVLNVVGGYAGWFSAERPVKRWKQALTVLSAMLPVSLTIALIRAEVAPDLPTALAVLISSAIGVTLLTYVLMPRLTTWLAGWLRR
jgi:antibiotic biosynthesis monooxygenase (ABM) superfamily enzyme